MTDQDHQPEPRPLVHGRRTRVAVALIGFLFSMGVPVAVLSSGPVPTVDGHTVGSLADPAGLGVTGALPGDPLPAGTVSAVVPSTAPDGLSGDPAAGPPGIVTPGDLPDGPLGIPGSALDAYQFAERTLAATRPGCHLSWSVLAGIGRIESGNASDGRVDAYGNTLGPILGPRLDGSPGMAAIPDTDHGQLDGDTVWDRAVGPMQFIPSSWRAYGVDGNGDGVANPNNVYDATITTGIYLCAGGANLADPAQLQAAVFRYNHSVDYVNVVLGWAQAYLTGVVLTPSAPGPVPPGINGNGGGLTVPDTASLAAAIAQPTPLAATPLATTSGPSPSPSLMTPSPVTTTPSEPPVTTPSPSPSPTSVPTPAPTTTPAGMQPPATTAPPVTTASPSLSPPIPTTTVAEPSPSPQPPVPTTNPPPGAPGEPAAGL